MLSPVRSAEGVAARRSEDTPSHQRDFISVAHSKRKAQGEDRMSANEGSSTCKRRLLAQHTLPQHFPQRRRSLTLQNVGSQPSQEAGACGSGELQGDTQQGTSISASSQRQLSPLRGSSMPLQPRVSPAAISPQLGASPPSSRPLAPQQTLSPSAQTCHSPVPTSPLRTALSPPSSPPPMMRRSPECPGAPMRPCLFASRRDTDMPRSRLNFDSPTQPGIRLLWRL